MYLLETVNKAYGTLSLGMIRCQFCQDHVPLCPAAVEGHVAACLNVISLSFRIPETGGRGPYCGGSTRGWMENTTSGSLVNGKY